MSELTINKQDLANIISHNSQVLVNATKEQMDDVKKMGFSRDFLERASPFIKIHLRNATNLPSRDGKKQFYDTESRSIRASKGMKKTMGSDRHLIDQWEVGFQTGRGGHGKIICSNEKTVYSRNGSYALLKLLWEGTSSYVVPINLSDAERKALFHTGGNQNLFQSWRKRRDAMKETIDRAFHEYERSLYKKYRSEEGSVPVKKSETQRWKEKLSVEQAGARGGRYDRGRGYVSGTAIDDIRVHSIGEKGESRTTSSITPGQTTVQLGKYKYVQVKGMKYDEFVSENMPKKMTFYNRFTGKFYYNRFMRRGIEGEVVKDFHDYVGDSIYKGLMDAYGEIKEEDVLAAIGQEKYV
jgi:hypothetical protein